MDNHAPADCQCPFCHFAKGGDTAYNTRGDIVYQYVGDDFYRTHDEHRFAAADERRAYAEKLKAFFAGQPR